MSLNRERPGGFGPERFQSADCSFRRACPGAVSCMAMIRPKFCSSRWERSHITTWGCETGFGGSITVGASCKVIGEGQKKGRSAIISRREETGCSGRGLRQGPRWGGSFYDAFLLVATTGSETKPNRRIGEESDI